MARKSLPLSKVYGLIEPGPVVMVTTARDGHPNIMTMSWHTMMESEPPLVGCDISNRNYSFGLLKATNECVINIPTVEIAEKVVGCGNSSGANIERMVAKYCFFVLEVIKAWIDPTVKNPRTIHHLGSGNFMVAGEKIKLRSKMK
jgi:flavin reductase (DIM6/NTAB) family NADH-FMN oxidoreductase RutF